MQYGHRKLQQDQEDHLEEIHTMAVRLKQQGRDINSELQRQDRMLGELDM
jgi:hypothetical protein